MDSELFTGGKMDTTAKNAIEVAKRELRIAQVQLKVIRVLAKVKPHLRRAILEIADDAAWEE